MNLRLDKLISASGGVSRSAAKEMIRAGRVRVDNMICKNPEAKFDLITCEVKVDEDVVQYRKNIYLMMNKPPGYISSTEDDEGPTAVTLLPEEIRKRKPFPVGRLDKDAQGFLLLTDDGAFAHAITSPKRHVDKTYFVRVEGELKKEDEHTFLSGITLSDGTLCKPARLEITQSGQISEAFVTLREGKYHQVKRMIASLGNRVLFLKRCSIGSVSLDPLLKPGEWRHLTPEEENLLKERDGF